MDNIRKLNGIADAVPAGRIITSDASIVNDGGARSYYINQLESFDKTINNPLSSVSWQRDILIRPGVTTSTESTSYTKNTFGIVGSQSAAGKPWISDNPTNLAKIALSGEKVNNPVNNLGAEISFSIIEQEKSQMTGQSIDIEQTEALQEYYQMCTDEMVYIGDEDKKAQGLVNSSDVAVGPVAGATWANKSAEEILEDVNTLLVSTWENSGLSVCPDKLLLPPAQFAFLASRLLNSGTDSNILEYLKRKSICMAKNKKPLEIFDAKYLAGVGVGATDRMVAYTQKYKFLRFPMAPIRRLRSTEAGISMFFPYIWAYGRIEIVYPSTIQYADGI